MPPSRRPAARTGRAGRTGRTAGGARNAHPAPPARRGRRTAAEAARTRARILDRAEALFARRGYRGVSVRALAAAAGVRPFTVQHHFGSKAGLYEAVLCRWDPELMARIEPLLAAGGPAEDRIRRALDALFGFFLERRDWVTLNVRAALGEDLPRGVAREDRAWARFAAAGLRRIGIAPGPGWDPRLLFITLEGMLSHHALATARYRHLFGRDLAAPRLRARTRAHLERVVLTLLTGKGGRS